MIDELCTREFQERHARNKRWTWKIVKFVAKPSVLLTIALMWLVMIGSKSHGTPPSWYLPTLGFVSLAWLCYVPLMLWLKFWRGVGRKGREIVSGVQHRRAIAVPQGLPTSASLAWITATYREVLAGVGLTETDAAGAAARQAISSAAALNGKGRLVRAAGSAALAADHLSAKRVPELMAVTPVSEYRSDLIFAMLPGQTASLWEAKHDELASGFRVPRVSVEQDGAQRAAGLVAVIVYHLDVLDAVEEFAPLEVTP